MIYVIKGLSNLLELASKGRLPHVSIGKPHEGTEPPIPTIAVDIGDIIDRDNPKIQQEIAIVMEKIVGCPVLPEQIRPYTHNPAEAILIGNPEVQVEENCVWVFVGEAFHYGLGIGERLMEDLREAGVEATWESDAAMTAEWEQGCDSGCAQCGHGDNEAFPEQWPIEGHSHRCSCRICTEVRAYFLALDRKRLEEQHGFIIHVVPGGDQNSPTGYNAHTHMDQKMVVHPDLQIVLPIPGETAASIFHKLVDRIKAGETFKAGDAVKDLFNDGDGRSYDGLVIDAQENERPVLRLILPDQEGNITRQQLWDVDAHGDFLLQYEV